MAEYELEIIRQLKRLGCSEMDCLKNGKDKDYLDYLKTFPDGHYGLIEQTRKELLKIGFTDDCCYILVEELVDHYPDSDLEKLATISNCEQFFQIFPELEFIYGES